MTGHPYPVIEHPREPNSLLGHPLKVGYQSHYVVTGIDGMPFSGKGQKYDEIVINQEVQVRGSQFLSFDTFFRFVRHISSRLIPKTSPR